MNTENIYMRMPFERIVEDSKAGVAKAKEALRKLNPDTAYKLGIGIEPEQANHRARVVQAVSDFYSDRKKRTR